MYPIGLQPLLDAVRANTTSWTVAYLFALLSFLVYVLPLWPEDDDKGVMLSGRLPFSIAPYFQRRFDFLHWGFEYTKQRIYRFRLLTNSVMVVSGDQGRMDFFNAKSLDLHEGFRVLSGALPFVQGVTVDLRQRRIAQIYKRLAAVQKTERLTELIPEILRDCRRAMVSWGKAGRLEPFDGIYELSVRCVTCVEIADDPAVVLRLRKWYDQVDRGTTAATVLFPWFPSPAMLRKAYATKQIYSLISNTITVRKDSGVARDDTLQMLLDAGDDHLMIVGFIMGLLIAGARSTGNTASWLITFLGCHPEWRNKARLEVQQLIASSSTPSKAAESDLADVLSTISVAAWETEAPVLDSLIRETLRISESHVAMRRNMGPTVHVDGKTLPSGSFALYPFSDVHLNPEFYSDPYQFDPSRPVRKDGYEFLGWGAGRITCLGQRLARLQLRLLTAMFVLNYDFQTVNDRGLPADPAPKPDWNDTLYCRPSNGQFFLDYRQPLAGKA
ncbi:cytochrome P450 [Dentipellis sp. KUC8613]|nr:cytochrome P450 [Dentipellis sp. KUC8613]